MEIEQKYIGNNTNYSTHLKSTGLVEDSTKGKYEQVINSNLSLNLETTIQRNKIGIK